MRTFRAAIGAIAVTAITVVSVSPGVGADTSPCRVDELGELVRSLPDLGPSQDVGDLMMQRYSRDRTVFTSVYIDSPTDIRVLLTDSPDHVEMIDGVLVQFVRSVYTLDELLD